MGHHRYINFSIGIDTVPGGGLKGGERAGKPTKDEKARVLAKFKSKLEHMKVDGYVVSEIADDLPEA